MASDARRLQSAKLIPENCAIATAVAVYALFMIVLGYWSTSQVESREDYLVAGRKLPLWLAWGSLLATWFGAATIIGASETAREEGVVGTLIDPFASGLSLIVAGLFAARMWRMNLLTMGDFFRERFGPKTEVVSSIVQAASYYPWLAGQFVALSKILHDALGWSPTASLLVAVMFVFYLTVSGGMWSVTITDTAQAFILLAALVMLGYAFFASFGDGSAVQGLSDVWQGTPPSLRTLLPETYVLAWIAWTTTLCTGVFGNIPGQDLMQRVFASKSPRVAVQACMLSGVIYIVFGLIPVLLGLASRIVLPDANTDEVSIITQMAEFALSPAMRVVFVIALLSIVVSTATSALLAPASLLARNVFEHVGAFRKYPLATERICVFLSVLISVGITFTGKQALEFLAQALEITLVALLVPFLGGFLGRPRGELPGLLAVVSGTVVWIAFNLAVWRLLPPNFESVDATGWQLFLALPSGLVGLVASAVGYAVGQWTSPAPAAPPLSQLQTA